jgi:hypothetical protein
VFAFHLGQGSPSVHCCSWAMQVHESFHPTIACLLSLHQPAMLFPTNFNEAEVLEMLRSICIFSVCYLFSSLSLERDGRDISSC